MKNTEHQKEVVRRLFTGKKMPEQLKEKLRLINTGKILSLETRNKMSLSRMGEKNCNFGKIFSKEHCERIRLSKLGTKRSEESKRKQGLRMSGSNHPAWKADRSLLAKRQIRNDMAYKEWRKNVWIRDGFKCQMPDSLCSGRIEAHHILVWSEYVELRYDVNNGITLCHAHHPRRRAEEKRLVPKFQELVSASR